MVPRPETNRLISPRRLPRPATLGKPLAHRACTKHAVALHNRRAHLRCAQPVSAPCAASQATQHHTHPDPAPRQSPGDSPHTGYLREASTYNYTQIHNGQISIRNTDRAVLPSKAEHEGSQIIYEAGTHRHGQYTQGHRDSYCTHPCCQVTCLKDSTHLRDQGLHPSQHFLFRQLLLFAPK